MPDRTTDGLVLKDHSASGAMYLKEGASLAGYDKVAITDVEISFKKNWQRDHNADIRSLANRVSDEDIVKIKQGMADEFYKIFEGKLNAAGYPTVDAAAADVLMVQPSIVNLDIFAPSVNPAGKADTYAAQAGEMTLVFELYDSVTSDIIARLIEAQAVGEHDIGHLSNRNTNLAAYRETLEPWADRLVDALNRARKASGD
jgi:hypothetical protein